MGSVGAAKIGGGVATNTVADTTSGVSSFNPKTDVDNLTTGQFLGDNFLNIYNGTVASVQAAVDRYAPDTLTIGGVVFNQLTPPAVMADGNREVTLIEYQSGTAINNEYPVLRVAIESKMSANGKTSSTKILKNGLFRTQFL